MWPVANHIEPHSLYNPMQLFPLIFILLLGEENVLFGIILMSSSFLLTSINTILYNKLMP